ncbi:MAG: hypothetical protein JWP14_359 [Frankiales bacterium]|nr:hypothetical protein [Frankiales bacterium]
MTTGVALAGRVGPPLGGLRRSDLPADVLREVEEEGRASRQDLLEALDDMLRWHEEVGGCLEHAERLKSLQRARDAGETARIEAFINEGALPLTWGHDLGARSITRRTRHMSDLNEPADSRMSVVEWTLSPDQATYEALLRLLFEDPVPVDEDDLRQLRGATWRA